MVLIKKFTFDAAHFLPGHPKCGLMHGHTWYLKVSIEGEPKKGMIMDFHDVDVLVKVYVLNFFDHKCLNDIFDYPSCENIVVWIWEMLEEKIETYRVKLQRIKLCETPDNCISYYGTKRNKI